MKQFNLILLLALLCTVNAFSQNVWQRVPGLPGGARIQLQKRTLAQPKLYQLNIHDLQSRLRGAPIRRGKVLSSNVVAFPNEEGNPERFSIAETSNMDPALAAKYPQIKAYVGRGVDDPSHVIYFSLSPLGFQSILNRPGKPTLYLEPYTEDKNTYVLTSSADETASLDPMECRAIEAVKRVAMNSTLTNRPNADDGIFRIYRLALTCTGEYSQFYGGNVVGALSGMNATLSRVNSIFERDFGVHLNMIADNDKLVYLDPATDPYTSDVSIGSGQYKWISEAASNVNKVIGTNGYDVSHLLAGSGNGGAASIGSVCGHVTSGFTGGVAPGGHGFDVRFVAHELGHSFGAYHVYSYKLDGSLPVEPSHGTSIMSYNAGDVQVPGQQAFEPYFNAISVGQVTTFVKSLSCGVYTPTGNSVPMVNAGSDYTIPKSTPFMLQGTASDADGDSLSYNWEEQDLATVALPNSASKTATGPAFASISPGRVPYRSLPVLSAVLSGANSTNWEIPPAVARTMNFRFTVRDHHSSGPANNSDDMVVTVSAASGPFKVTSPNTTVTWAGGSAQTITWDVANTTAAPVNCANVKISMSLDGGQTFPTVLAESTPNDGSETITIPNTPNATVRIKIEAVGNIFYDICDKDIYISNTGIFEITSSVVQFGFGTITPNGVTPVVGGQSQTYTIASIENHAINDVKVDGVSKGTISSYTFTNVNAAHTISVSFHGNCVTGKPAAITGETLDLCGERELTYVSRTVSGATSYEWAVPPGFTLVSGQGTATLKIRTPAIFTKATLSVRAVGPCGAGEYRSIIISGAPGDLSSQISGPTDVITGTENVYSLPAVPGLSYAWSAEGSTVVSGANTPSATIKAGETSGYVLAVVTNACGAGPTAKKYVTVTPGEECIPPKLYTGIYDVACYGTKTGAIVTAAEEGSEPYSFKWTGPDGFESTDININSLGAGLYTLVVAAKGGCTTTATYQVSQPPSPVSITVTAGAIACNGGTTTVTVSADGGSPPYRGTGVFTNQAAGTHTYSVTDLHGCTISKTITIDAPSPLQIVVTPGTIGCDETTTSVTVSASGGTAPYTGTGVLSGQEAGTHTYTVTDANGCSVSKTILVSASDPGNAPVTPTAIAGETLNLCGAKEVTYSIDAVVGATSYDWEIPAGFTLLSGQGTTTVTIRTPATFTTGEIKVRAANLCEKSFYRSLVVTGAPGSSGEITGPAEVVAGAEYVYSVPATAGVSYAWSAEGAIVVDGANSNSVTIKAGNTNGYVTAMLSNACGAAPVTKKNFTVSGVSFNVYPNPSKSLMTVAFSALEQDVRFEVKVTDVYGRVLMRKTGLTVAGVNTLQVNLAGYTPGVYMVSLTKNNHTSTEKIFKGN